MSEYLPKKNLNNQALGILPFFILFVGLCITFFVWRYTQDSVTRTAQDQFNIEVDQIEYALRGRIKTYYDSLYALQGLFAASDSVERREWNPFVKKARIGDYPDIEYVSYIEVVTDDDKEEFIENFQNDRSPNPAGYPNFRIYPEETRSEYAVVKYIDPENEESSLALGFDLYSSPPQKTALDSAADTNQPVASEILNLATDGSTGFIIIAPVYENGRPMNTAQERRTALKGFVTVAFKTSSLFADIFSTDSHPNIVFTIYDENTILHTSEHTENFNPGADVNGYTSTKTLGIGGRTWLLEAVSNPTFADSFSERRLPTIIGIGGIVVSFLLFLIFYYSGKRTSQLIQIQSAALEATANSVVITDNKGIIQWVNPAFTKLTGYEAHEAVGQSTRILNSGKQDKTFYQNLWNSIMAGRVWKGEIVNKRKDGTLYQEEEMISPVTDTRGKITHFIAIKQDISQRKRIEEKMISANEELEDSKKAIVNILEDLNKEKAKLAQENIKNEAIVASIGEGLIVTDKTGKIVTVNNACEKLLGLQGLDVIGKDMVDAIPKYNENHELITKEKRSLTKVLEGKTKKESVSTLTTTHYYMRRDKTRLPIVGMVTPIVINGRIAGAVQVFRDVSHEKEIDQLKDEFVSVASHELRTPLTAIDGLVSMLLEGEYGPVTQELKQPLEDIYSSSERLIRLVNDLLSLSRIQAGRLKFIMSTFELSPVVNNVVDSLQSISKDKGIELKVGTIDNIPVQGDVDKVKQVLNNLIGNALKFTDTGSITISSALHDDLVEISIKDTGIGISKEDQSKLFGKFQQLETAQGRPPGTGLGLHISREMACKMGGDVWLEKSEPGKGSTFVFSLPKADTELSKKTEQEIEQESEAHPDQKSN